MGVVRAWRARTSCALRVEVVFAVRCDAALSAHPGNCVALKIRRGGTVGIVEALLAPPARSVAFHGVGGLCVLKMRAVNVHRARGACVRVALRRGYGAIGISGTLHALPGGQIAFEAGVADAVLIVGAVESLVLWHTAR